MIATHERATVVKNIEDTLVEQIIAQLTGAAGADDAAAADREPAEREIVFAGTFDEVNDHFLRNQWSDGLPIVPPTLAKIDEFLQHTDREPDEVIGVMNPSLTAATVWNVAVNGVMADRKRHV